MTPDAPTSEPRQADVPAKSTVATLRTLTTLVAPTTLVTGLLYYFGWARTSTQAHLMGLDDSLFGFSARDYILRSITAMFWPLFTAAVGVLVGLLGHGLLLAWAGVSAEQTVVQDASRRRALGAITLALATIGGIALLLGGVGSRVSVPSRFVSVAAPLAITVSVVLLAYAAYLQQAFLRPAPAGSNTPRRPSISVSTGLAWSMVTALVLLSSFWTVSHYAAIKGEDFAREAVLRLPFQPSVTIYSTSRLHLQQPVIETALAADETAAYRYVYSGLKLLFRADDKLFLRPSDPTSARNIVIAEDAGIRVEYE